MWGSVVMEVVMRGVWWSEVEVVVVMVMWSVWVCVISTRVTRQH